MKFIKLIINKLLKKIGLILLYEKNYLYLSRSHPYMRTLDLIQQNILNKNYLFKIQSFFNDNGFSLLDITLIKNTNSKNKIKMLELAFLKN